MNEESNKLSEQDKFNLEISFEREFAEHEKEYDDLTQIIWPLEKLDPKEISEANNPETLDNHIKSGYVLVEAIWKILEENLKRYKIWEYTTGKEVYGEMPDTTFDLHCPISINFPEEKLKDTDTVVATTLSMIDIKVCEGHDYSKHENYIELTTKLSFRESDKNIELRTIGAKLDIDSMDQETRNSYMTSITESVVTLCKYLRNWLLNKFYILESQNDLLLKHFHTIKLLDKNRLGLEGLRKISSYSKQLENYMFEERENYLYRGEK